MGAQPPDEPLGSGFGDSELEAVFATASPADTLAAVLTEARMVLAEVDSPLDAELWGSDIVAAIGSAGQADAIVAATLAIVQRDLARGEVATLRQRLPLLAYLALAPFTGPLDAARLVEQLAITSR